MQAMSQKRLHASGMQAMSQKRLHASGMQAVSQKRLHASGVIQAASREHYGTAHYDYGTAYYDVTLVPCSSSVVETLLPPLRLLRSRLKSPVVNVPNKESERVPNKEVWRRLPRTEVAMHIWRFWGRVRRLQTSVETHDCLPGQAVARRQPRRRITILCTDDAAGSRQLRVEVLNRDALPTG